MVPDASTLRGVSLVCATDGGHEGDTDHPTGSGGDHRAPKPAPLTPVGIVMHLCAVGTVWG